MYDSLSEEELPAVSLSRASALCPTAVTLPTAGPGRQLRPQNAPGRNLNLPLWATNSSHVRPKAARLYGNTNIELIRCLPAPLLEPPRDSRGRPGSAASCISPRPVCATRALIRPRVQPAAPIFL